MANKRGAVGRILVTGVTGNIGSQILAQLPSTGLDVLALVRNPDGATLPAHVQGVCGDLTRPETLDKYPETIDTVFLLWVSPADLAAPALERIAKYARRIVFLAAPLKTAHPLFQQPNPSRARAELIEQLIESSGRCALAVPRCSHREDSAEGDQSFRREADQDSGGKPITIPLVDDY